MTPNACLSWSNFLTIRLENGLCGSCETLAVPLSSQEYKRYYQKCLENLTKLQGGVSHVAVMDSIPSRGSIRQKICLSNFMRQKVKLTVLVGGERNRIGRREKWSKKVGRREKSGRKCREEGKK